MKLPKPTVTKGNNYTPNKIFHFSSYNFSRFFFLENPIIRIGQCISGQTLQKAVKNVRRVIDQMNDKVIINLGSLDLMHGRELIDMMKDTFELCNILTRNNIFPVLTTIPPIANHMHNKDLDRKRKSFNMFLLENLDCIDIENCFLSNEGRILFNCYQM